MAADGSVTSTTGYVNYVYNISSRGTAQVASQLMGLSGIAGNVLGQLAFQTSSYLSTTEGSLLTLGTVASASLSKATEFAMKFNQEMETVHAISGKSVTKLADDAMEMSNKYGVALDSMTKGLEALARAGVSTGNMTTILDQAMGLSKLEGLPLEKSINALISTTNLLDTSNLDLESPEYAEAVKYQTQKITATSEAAPINAQDIIHTLEHVGGYASSTKLDQDDLYAVIAQLGSKGTKSEMAGTSLRAFLAAGQKDTAQRALKRIGLNVKDLWKDDETIMSISDMKDVLDEAMEARGYTQQEKLEFYSDFAGYKQANQIMKIDTTSVREFKDKIDRSWETSKKMETILNTAQTNLQSLMQTGVNFLTKVGEPFLPIVSVISKTLKTMIDIVNAIPFSNWIVAGGLTLVSVKAISTVLNKILPSLLAHENSIFNMKNLWEDTRESVKETFDIISNAGDFKQLRLMEVYNEANRITDNDKIEYWGTERGLPVKDMNDVRIIEAKVGGERIDDIRDWKYNKIFGKTQSYGNKNDDIRNRNAQDQNMIEAVHTLKNIENILKNTFGDGQGANVDSALGRKIDDLSKNILELTHVHQGSLEAVNSTINNTYELLNGTKQSTQGSSMSFDLPGIKEMTNLLKESNTIVSDIDLSSLDSIDENISHILDTVITLTNVVAKDNKVSRNKFVGKQEKAQALTGFGSLVDQGNAYAQRVETTARTKRVEKEEAERILNQGLFDIDKFLEKNMDTLVKAWTKKGIDRRKFDKLDFDFGFDTSTFEGQEMERIVRGMLLDAFKSYNIGIRTRLKGLSKEALIGDMRNRVRLRQDSYNGTGSRNTALGNYVETILPYKIQNDNPQGFYVPGEGKEKKTVEVVYVDDQGNTLKDEYGNVRKERVPVMESRQGIGYEYEPKSGARVTSEKDVKVKDVTYKRQVIGNKPGKWVDLSQPGTIPTLSYGLSDVAKTNADTGKKLTQAQVLEQRQNLFRDSFRIATTIDDRKTREVENFTGDEINTLFKYMRDELSVDFVKLLAGKSYEDMKPSEVKDFKKRLKDEFDGTLKLGKNGGLSLGDGISNQQRGMNAILQILEADDSQRHIQGNLINFVTKRKNDGLTELQNRTKKAEMDKLSIPQLKAIAMLGGVDLTDAYTKKKDGSLGRLDKSKAIELLGNGYGQVPFEIMEDFRSNPATLFKGLQSAFQEIGGDIDLLMSGNAEGIMSVFRNNDSRISQVFEAQFKEIVESGDKQRMMHFIKNANVEQYLKSDAYAYAQKLETLYSAPFARVFTQGGLTGKLKKEFEDTFNISGDSDWEKMANFIMNADGSTLEEADKWVGLKLGIPSFDNYVKYSPEGNIKYNSHSMLDRNISPDYITTIANVGQDGIHGVRGNFASLVSLIMELAFNEASDEIKEANTTTPNWLSDKRWQMLNDPVNPNREYKNLEETKDYGLRKKNMDAHRFDDRYTGTIGDENVDNEKLVVSNPKSYNPQTSMTMVHRAIGLIKSSINDWGISDDYIEYLTAALDTDEIDADTFMNLISNEDIIDTIFDTITANGDWDALDGLLLLDNMWGFGADFKKKVEESKKIRREQHYNSIDPFAKERKEMTGWDKDKRAMHLVDPAKKKASAVPAVDSGVQQGGRAEYEPMPALVDDNGVQVIAGGIFMRRPTHGRDFHRNVKTEKFTTNAQLTPEQFNEIDSQLYDIKDKYNLHRNLAPEELAQVHQMAVEKYELHENHITTASLMSALDMVNDVMGENYTLDDIKNLSNEIDEQYGETFNRLQTSKFQAEMNGSLGGKGPNTIKAQRLDEELAIIRNSINEQSPLHALALILHDIGEAEKGANSAVEMLIGELNKDIKVMEDNLNSQTWRELNPDSIESTKRRINEYKKYINELSENEGNVDDVLQILRSQADELQADMKKIEKEHGYDEKKIHKLTKEKGGKHTFELWGHEYEWKRKYLDLQNREFLIDALQGKVNNATSMDSLDSHIAKKIQNDIAPQAEYDEVATVFLRNDQGVYSDVVSNTLEMNRNKKAWGYQLNDLRTNLALDYGISEYDIHAPELTEQQKQRVDEIFNKQKFVGIQEYIDKHGGGEAGAAAFEALRKEMLIKFAYQDRHTGEWIEYAPFMKTMEQIHELYGDFDDNTMELLDNGMVLDFNTLHRTHAEIAEQVQLEDVLKSINTMEEAKKVVYKQVEVATDLNDIKLVIDESGEVIQKIGQQLEEGEQELESAKDALQRVPSYLRDQILTGNDNFGEFIISNDKIRKQYANFETDTGENWHMDDGRFGNDTWWDIRDKSYIGGEGPRFYDLHSSIGNWKRINPILRNSDRGDMTMAEYNNLVLSGEIEGMPIWKKGKNGEWVGGIDYFDWDADIGDDIKELVTPDMKISEFMDILSSSINKYQLQENTTLWRGGYLNTDENGVGTFTGLTSTAMDKGLAEMFSRGENDYLIEILAPEGTMGSMDTHVPGEFLLDTGMQYYELERDDKEKTATVALLDPTKDIQEQIRQIQKERIERVRNASTDTINDVVSGEGVQNIVEEHKRTIPELYEALRDRGDFEEMLEGIYQVDKELYQQLVDYVVAQEESVNEGVAKYKILKEMSKTNATKAANFVLERHDILAEAMEFREQMIADEELKTQREVMQQNKGTVDGEGSFADVMAEMTERGKRYQNDMNQPSGVETMQGIEGEDEDDEESYVASVAGYESEMEDIVNAQLETEHTDYFDDIDVMNKTGHNIIESGDRVQSYINMVVRNLESQGYSSKQISQIEQELYDVLKENQDITDKSDIRNTKRNLRKMIFKREALVMNLLGEEGTSEFFDFKTREATPDDIEAFNAQKSKYLNKEDLDFIKEKFKISSDAGTAKDRSRDVKRQLKRRGLWDEALNSLRRNKYGDIYEMSLDQLLEHIKAIDEKINANFDFDNVDIVKLGAESDMIDTVKNANMSHINDLARNQTKAQDMANNVLDEQAYKDAMIANMPEAFDQEEVINAVNRQQERELEKERKRKEEEEAKYRASLAGVQYTDAYVDAPNDKDIRYHQGSPLYESKNEFFDQKSYDRAKKQFYNNPTQRTFARYARMKEQNPYDDIDNVIFDELAKQEYERVKTDFYMNPNLETFDALNAMGSSNVYGKYFQEDAHYNDTYLRIAEEAFQRDLQEKQERERTKYLQSYYADNVTMKEANGVQYAESNWLTEMWQGAQYSAAQGIGGTDALGEAVAGIKSNFYRFLGKALSDFSNVDLTPNYQVIEATDKFNQHLTKATNHLNAITSVLHEFSDVFPPLEIAVLGVQSVIAGISKIQGLNTKVQDFMNMGIALSEGRALQSFIPGGEDITADTYLGQFIMGASSRLSKAMTVIGDLLNKYTPALMAIGASLFVVKVGLDWSYQSHQKWLKTLEEEQKERRSRTKSLQATAQDARSRAEKNRAPRQQDALDRSAILAQQRLENANMSRAKGAIDLTRAKNDTLWGDYGISAGLSKISGTYESTADEYDGTSKEIRKIKEATLANPFATGSMRQVAAYYDANQLAFGQMDEYKDELGELYDMETNIMKKVGPDQDARSTPQFQKALDKFVEATGITRDHAQKYLDYMQTEHNVDKATQAMQAQADTISAQTEMKIQAISFGGNPADVLGLNGIEAQQNAMIKAQADMIKMELSGQLWWKAVWATITAPIKLIISPIFAIANILGAIWAFMTGNWSDAWDKAGKAAGSFNAFDEAATYWGAWGEVEGTDFTSIGQNAVDERNRRNYGNATATASGMGYHNAPKVPSGKYDMTGQFFQRDKPQEPSSFHHDRKQGIIAGFFGGVMSLLGTIISILTTGLLLGGVAAGVKKIFDAKGISINADSLSKGFGAIKDKITGFDLGNIKDLTLKDMVTGGAEKLKNISLGGIWDTVSGKGKGLKETIKNKAMWGRFGLENLIYGQPEEGSGAIIKDGKVVPTGERSGGLKDKYQSFIEQHKDNAWVQYGNKKLQSAKQLPDKLKEQYVNPWKDYISEQASSYVNGLIPLGEDYDDFNKKKRSYMNKDDLDFIAEKYGITSDEKTAKLRSRDVRKQLDEKGLWGEASEELYRRQQKEAAGGPLGIVKAHINEKYVDPWKEHIQKRADQGKEKGKEWLASQKDKFMDKYGERFGLTVGDTSIFDALQDPEKMESFVKDKFANAKDGTLLAQVRDKVTTGKELLQDPEKLHGILKDKYGDKIQRGKELLQDPEAMEGFVKDKFTNLKDKVTNFFDIDDEDDGKSFFRKHFDNIKEKVMSFFGKKGEADETGEDTPLLNTSEIIQNTTMEDAKEAMGKLFGPKALPGDDEDVIDLGPDEWSTVSSKIEGSFTDRIRDYIDGLQGTMGDIFENMKNNIQGFDIGEKFQSVKDRLSSLFGDDENGEPGFFKKHFNKFKDKIFSFFGKKSEGEPEDGGMIDSLPGTAQKLLGMSDDDGVIDLGPDEWSTVSSSIETSFTDRIRNKFRRKKKDVEPESEPEPEDVGEGEYKYNSMFDFFRDLRREKKESQAMEAEAAAANAKKMAKEKHMYQGEYYEGFDLGDNLNIDEGVSRTFHKAKDKISEKFGLSDKIPLLGGGGSIVPHRKPAGSVEGSSPSLLGGDNGIIDLMPGEWSTVSTSSEGGSLFDRVRSGFSDKRNSASSAFGNAKEFMSNKLGGGKLGGGKVGGALKGLGGKLGKTGIGKAGSKVLSKVGGKLGGKLLAKGGSQVLSKVLAGGLAATGIGAPLAAIMASPIGGFLVEGAMNLGGAVLGGAGKLLGGAKKALGFGGYNNTGKGGGGFLGGLLKASPLGMLGGALGLGGLVAGGLGAMFGGILGLGKGAKGGANLMKAASPLSMINVLKGAKDIAEKHLSIGEKQKKAMDKVVENTSNHNNNNASGGSITIQNININTDDDPEAIKAMFLDLIVELQEQVNPRLVSRTTGSSNTSTSDSSTQTSSTQSQEPQSSGGSNSTNTGSGGN